jgi:hypothetical protein
MQENRYGNRWDEITYTLTRVYEFADPRAPATVSTLEIECPVSISGFEGYIHSYVYFTLRPHVYLGLGQLPAPEEGMVTAPFSVWLVTEGEGTQASPLIDGGVFKVRWESIGDDEPDDPELARLWVSSMEDEIRCLRVIASGKEMTFTIVGDTEPAMKLQLRLPNGKEFRQLWDDVCKRLRRQHASGVPEYYWSREPAGLVGWLRRLFIP